jgi:hypothetical protein
LRDDEDDFLLVEVALTVEVVFLVEVEVVFLVDEVVFLLLEDVVVLRVLVTGTTVTCLLIKPVEVDVVDAKFALAYTFRRIEPPQSSVELSKSKRESKSA